MPTASFQWRDGERTIHFGRGALEQALPSLGNGYVLLTTSRALEMAPALADRAAVVYSIAPGRVDELAGELLDEVDGELLVALGGGRVIDTAKALAAARAPGVRPRVAAVPTTLSAAEMTAVHRRAAGADGALPGVRPAIVVNDPALERLAAGRRARGQRRQRARPRGRGPGDDPRVAGAGAGRSRGRPAHRCGVRRRRRARSRRARARRLAVGLRDRQLRLRAAPRHVADARAAHRRGPRPVECGDAAAHAGRAGAPGRESAGELVGLATDLAARANAVRLRDLGVTEEQLEACADAAAGRAELDLTPPRADRDELRALYAAAF